LPIRLVGKPHGVRWFNASGPTSFISYDVSLNLELLYRKEVQVMKRRLLFLFVLLTLLSGLSVTFTKSVHAETNVTQLSSKCINPSGTNVLHGQL